MTDHGDDNPAAFAHVFWLGGPPDGGKTSVAALLAERHGLGVYHFDRHEPAHFARADPRRHPALHAAHSDRLTTEQRWLGAPPEAMARDTIASWTERLGMALDDLRALPTAPPIVAEGPGFFPATLLPLLADRRRAVWLLPTEPFKRASATRRDKPGTRHETSDPARAQENLIRRDLLLGEQMRREATALGLATIAIDGSQSIAGIATLVEAQFAPWLYQRRGNGGH